jgi:hypothetical protein
MNWKRLAKRLILRDGAISHYEAQIVEEETLADGRVDRDELAFLQEVRRGARQVAPEFDEFFFRVLKRIVLADGVISEAEAQWLRGIILADGQVTEPEAKFLAELRKEATAWGAAFDALCRDCLPEWRK